MTVHSWTLDRLVEEYTQHERRTRGLRPRTLHIRGRLVRMFVRGALGTDPIDPTSFAPADVVGFLTSLCGRFSPRSIQSVRSSLRSFFRFLRFKGFCNDGLEAALPVVARLRLATLPRSLTDQQVEQVLASFDASNPCGHRDQAIVQCLATLGLRPGEVASLCLDDIDWRGGTLQIRARKNRRGAVLPLPRVVGQALIGYLSGQRPATDERRVFVVHQKERRGKPLSSAGTRIGSNALRRFLHTRSEASHTTISPSVTASSYTHRRPRRTAGATAFPFSTRIACLRWYPVSATNSLRIHPFSVAVLCRYLSATAPTNSRRASELIIAIVPPFGSRHSEATTLTR